MLFPWHNHKYIGGVQKVTSVLIEKDWDKFCKWYFFLNHKYTLCIILHYIIVFTIIETHPKRVQVVVYPTYRKVPLVMLAIPVETPPDHPDYQNNDSQGTFLFFSKRICESYLVPSHGCRRVLLCPSKCGYLILSVCRSHHLPKIGV